MNKIVLSAIVIAALLSFSGCNREKSEEVEKDTGFENGFQYVDLGLSVKWATVNVGASKPEEYGDYYAWGEIESKTEYNWSTYKWCDAHPNLLTKYNYTDWYGTVDKKTLLDAEDDVAHIKWGGKWRIPTTTEQEELYSHCTWTWTVLNGVNGYLVTSNKKGYTDRSIFLPANGCRDGSGIEGNVGIYSSRSLETTSYMRYLGFDSVNVYTGFRARYYGMGVRPVCP